MRRAGAAPGLQVRHPSVPTPGRLLNRAVCGDRAPPTQTCQPLSSDSTRQRSQSVKVGEDAASVFIYFLIDWPRFHWDSLKSIHNLTFSFKCFTWCILNKITFGININELNFQLVILLILNRTTVAEGEFKPVYKSVVTPSRLVDDHLLSDGLRHRGCFH